MDPGSRPHSGASDEDERKLATLVAESIESLKDRCGLFMGDACRMLGLKLLQGKEAPQDIPGAVDALSRACETGDAEGCHLLGAVKGSIDSVRDSPEAVFELFQRGCTLGLGKSCVTAGFIAARGAHGGSKDPLAAAEFYNTACGLNDADGCLQLALAIEDAPGLFAEVSDPTVAAAQYARKACELGSADACFISAVNCADGSGVAKDALRAASLFGRSCKLGLASGCYQLGASYATGLGVPKDPVLAAKYFRIACENNSEPGCLNFAAMLYNGEGVPHNPKAAQAIYQRATALKAAREAQAKGGAPASAPPM